MTKSLTLTPNQNNLLATLPTEDRALLVPALKDVSFKKGVVLERPGKRIDMVYFPLTGVGSILAVGSKGRRVESGLFSSDGMSGTAIVMESDISPHETVMQIAGEGCCLPADALRDAMRASASLRRHLLRYVQALSVQIAQTALSNAQAKLEERLARWLLMCHDRTAGDELALTHEFLSIMLSVRRAGVTVGIHALESKAMIAARRGCVVVLDRDALLEEAQGSYGIPEREYERLIQRADAA